MFLIVLLAYIPRRLSGRNRRVFWRTHPTLPANSICSSSTNRCKQNKTCVHMFFFSLASFFRDWVSVSCFTGQLPGIGTVFILASLQMCKVQRQSPLASQGGWGGGGWSLRGQGGVVQGDCDGGLGLRK